MQDLKILEDEFSEIKSLCVMKFLSAPAEKQSYLFSLLVNKCEIFLKKYKEYLFNDDDIFVDTRTVCKDEYDEIREEILRAYGPVWMDELFRKDDAFFLSREQVSLRDWDDSHSPYEDLHRVSSEFYDNNGITDRDVFHFFKKAEEILKTDMPIDKFEAQIKLLFSKYNMTTDLNKPYQSVEI